MADYGAWQKDLGLGSSKPITGVIVLGTGTDDVTEYEIRGSDDPDFGTYDLVAAAAVIAGTTPRVVAVSGSPARRYWRVVLVGSGDSLDVTRFELLTDPTLPTQVTLVEGGADVYQVVAPGGGGAGGSGGGSGALVLLEQQTASDSASLDFTSCISADYDEYLIEIIDLLPATAGASPRLQVSTDGGSTYEATGYYWSQNNSQIGAASGGANGGSNVAAIQLWGATGGVGQGNAAADTFSGSFRLYNPLGTTQYKYLRGEGLGHFSGNNGWYQFSMGGFWFTTTAVDAFRILYSSGNIASGTIRVYGVAKS